MKQPVLVEAKNLSKQFGERLVVDDVSFQVQRGEIFGFLGPNGSGKSTVIKLLCGLLQPSSGEGYIDGLAASEASVLIRQRIGYVAQRFGLYADLSVEQNLAFYGKAYGVSNQDLPTRIDELCQLTKLTPYRQLKAGRLSGGWKQRLALASALLHRPKVLFLDEPTAGIDPVARREVWDLLFDLSVSGMTLFVTTHYMDEAERCTQVAYIYLSRLIALGTVRALTEQADLIPVGYRQYELSGSPLMRLYELLIEDPALLQPTIFGAAIHCLVPSDRELAGWQQTLGEAGIAELTIKPMKPTLEDVFVTLTARAEEQR